MQRATTTRDRGHTRRGGHPRWVAAHALSVCGVDGRTRARAPVDERNEELVRVRAGGARAAVGRVGLTKRRTRRDVHPAQRDPQPRVVARDRGVAREEVLVAFVVKVPAQTLLYARVEEAPQLAGDANGDPRMRLVRRCGRD